MQTLKTLTALIEQCEFQNWDFYIGSKGTDLYLQVQFDGVCINSGKEERQHGRKWMLSRHMTDSEVIQTAFKAVQTAMEHEVREYFTFQNEPVFRPHYDVYELVQLSRDNKVSKRENHNPDNRNSNSVDNSTPLPDRLRGAGL